MEKEDFVRRIVRWNMQRYPQQHNKCLTVQLLCEEVLELGSAEGRYSVDTLDALVDIVYVAIGAMWKMGLNSEQIHEAIHIVCDSNASKSTELTNPSVKANINKGPNFISPEPRLQALLDSVPFLKELQNDSYTV